MTSTLDTACSLCGTAWLELFTCSLSIGWVHLESSYTSTLVSPHVDCLCSESDMLRDMQTLAAAAVVQFTYREGMAMLYICHIGNGSAVTGCFANDSNQKTGMDLGLAQRLAEREKGQLYHRHRAR